MRSQVQIEPKLYLKYRRLSAPRRFSNPCCSRNNLLLFLLCFRDGLDQIQDSVQNLLDMIKRSFLASASIIGILGVASVAQADDIKYHSITDGSIYVKPYTNMKGQWNNEYGYQAKIASSGNASFKVNIAYVQTYPLVWKSPSQWSAGGTLEYVFDKSGNVTSGIYTKIQNDLVGLWQQESGYMAHTKLGKIGVTFNAGYIWDYPYNSSDAPKWNVGLTFSYKFK